MSAVEPFWGRLELMGHRVLNGRIAEVEMFGVKLIRIEEPLADGSLREPAHYNPTAMYGLTPMTEEAARKQSAWQRGDTLPALPPHEPRPLCLEDQDEDEDSGDVPLDPLQESAP